MTKVLALALVIVLVLPADVPPQCEQLVYARANPGLCFDTPFPDFTDAGHGSGGGGGILGTIGRVLGGLTGGLL